MIDALRQKLHRLRLAMAEADLAWMRTQAHRRIQETQARITTLRHRCGLPTQTPTIAHHACREKRGMLAGGVAG